MVDQRAYNYLKKHSGKYNVNDLKKKLIKAGYSKKAVDEAAMALKKTFQGSRSQPAQKTIMPQKKPVMKKIPAGTAGAKTAKPAAMQKVRFNVPKINEQRFRVQKPVQQQTGKQVSSQTNVQGKNQKQKTQMKSEPQQMQKKQQTQQQQMQQEPKKSRKWLWIILLVVAVLIIAGGITAYFLFLK